MANIFNEQMTSLEARATLFNSVVGKSKQEANELFKEYKAVLPIIIKRETYEGSNLINL